MAAPGRKQVSTGPGDGFRGGAGEGRVVATGGAGKVYLYTSAFPGLRRSRQIVAEP